MVTSAAPAGATPLNSSLTCTPGTTPGSNPVISCYASDPDQIAYLSIRNVSTNSLQARYGNDPKCGTADVSSISFEIPRDGSSYKITIVDCQSPTKAKDIWKVSPGGTVTGPK